ncbi:hypothetical protein A1D22_00225 [Pasteurellaceae bacterium LFhippo2]|nr:hypothetical protein [Pasteurellaceae bacterium LFhippo2]
MTAMNNLLKLNQRIHDFINAKGLDGAEINLLKNNNLPQFDTLKKNLDEQNNIDRLLRIGIIGRVKAGKSSLLNALLFDGRDILPQAATPMTAALTRMEYSEDIKAEIELYDEKDLVSIRENAEEYQRLYQHIKDQEVKRLRNERNQAQQNSMYEPNIPLKSDSEIERLASNLAKVELEKHSVLVACFEQYSEIKKADINSKRIKTEIKAGSINGLMGILQEYVGSGGKYMPFTKSVKLSIPEPGLKGLEIVDTPGVNDPVQSREARTNEFLTQCDVVFVVSPAGQFLNADDVELMQRVTSREGIQEAYLIASQVDHTLFGDVRDEYTDPRNALNKISSELYATARNALQKLRERNPSMQRIADIFLSKGIICTSSMAYQLLRNSDTPSQYSNSAKQVLKNLSRYYPDYFDENEITQVSKSALKDLSNVDNIKGILQELQTRKIEIQEKRRDDFIKASFSNHDRFLEQLESVIQRRIEDIEDGDIEVEREKLNTFERNRNELSDLIDQHFISLTREVEDKLKYGLLTKLKLLVENFQRINRLEENSEIENYIENYVEKGWIWDSIKQRNAQRTVIVDSISASAIRDFISSLVLNVPLELGKFASEYNEEWRKELLNNLARGIHKINSNGENLRVRQIHNTINSTLLSIPVPEFELILELPESLQRTGTLKDAEARVFSDNASRYLHEKLIVDIKQRVEEYANNVGTELKSIDLSKKVTSNFENEIKRLIDEINCSSEAIESYKNTIKELGILKMELTNVR